MKTCCIHVIVRACTGCFRAVFDAGREAAGSGKVPDGNVGFDAVRTGEQKEAINGQTRGSPPQTGVLPRIVHPCILP